MATSYQEAVEKTIIASEQLNQIVNGTATAEIVVEDGSKIPSVRKALVDNFYFKDPLPWQQGQSETVFNQLRKFSDGTLWYAPTATSSNVVTMGVTPVGDPLWVVYSLDAIPKLKPQIRESLRRSYAEAGYNLVAGSFEGAGTLTGTNDVLLQEFSGRAYQWSGALPKIVPTNSTPQATGGISPNGNWVDVGDALLRSELAVASGSALVGFTQAGASPRRRTAEEKMRDVISLDDYANGTGVETPALNNAMAEAVRVGGYIEVKRDFQVDGTQVDPITTLVPMLGSGKIDGVYRKFVSPQYYPDFNPVNTINPSAHLIKLSATDSPTVVIMGDSISTEGPDSQCSAVSMWSLLTEKLQKDNPKKQFTFHNRAIGGQTWLNANDNTRPSVGVTWWYTSNKPWLDYIQELSPDVVFLAFGMNDSNGFNSGALISVVNKIKSWIKVPDIIFVTNPVPAQTTIYPDGTGFGFRGQTFQEGRDYVAGFTRSFATANGYGIIDINRAMVAVRDGYDVTAGPLRVVSTTQAEYMVASEAALDFAFRGVCNGAAWPEGKVLLVKVGLNADDFIFIKKLSGNFVVEGFTPTLNTYASKTTNVPVPSTNFGFEISIIGGIARLIIAPTSVTFSDKQVIAEFKVIRHGGIFLPLIGWQATPVVSGPFVSITYLTGYGVPKYRQTLLDSDIWGPSTISPDIKPIWGGNGINHFSAKGIDYLVRPVIDACDFSSPSDTHGYHAGGEWVRYANGVSEFSKKVTLSNVSVNSPIGSIFVQSTENVDTDFPDIFMSDGMNGYVFEVSIHVVTDSSQFLWVVGGGSSKLNNAIRYRLASGLPVTSASVDCQIIMRGKWK